MPENRNLNVYRRNVKKFARGMDKTLMDINNKLNDVENEIMIYPKEDNDISYIEKNLAMLRYNIKKICIGVDDIETALEGVNTHQKTTNDDVTDAIDEKFDNNESSAQNEKTKLLSVVNKFKENNNSAEADIEQNQKHFMSTNRYTFNANHFFENKSNKEREYNTKVGLCRLNNVDHSVHEELFLNLINIQQESQISQKQIVDNSCNNRFASEEQTNHMKLNDESDNRSFWRNLLKKLPNISIASNKAKEPTITRSRLLENNDKLNFVNKTKDSNNNVKKETFGDISPFEIVINRSLKKPRHEKIEKDLVEWIRERYMNTGVKVARNKIITKAKSKGRSKCFHASISWYLDFLRRNMEIINMVTGICYGNDDAE